MPDQCVTAYYLLPVRLGKVDNLIGLAVVELARVGLRELPFLRVADRDLAKVELVGQDGPVGAVFDLRVVHSGAEVELPGRLGQLMQPAVGHGGHYARSRRHQESGQNGTDRQVVFRGHCWQ